MKTYELIFNVVAIEKFESFLNEYKGDNEDG
jgi:hypothetical protein